MSHPYLSLAVLLALMGLALASSKTAYYWYLRRSARRLLRRADCEPGDLEYSLHGLTYSISVPSHDPAILKARREDFSVQIETDSLLYPRVLGVRIVLPQQDGAELSIAHLDLREYRSAVLDRFLLNGDITRHGYERIAAASLLDRATQRRLQEHVYGDIQKKPYER